jgi:hypothetical protein
MSSSHALLEHKENTRARRYILCTWARQALGALGGGPRRGPKFYFLLSDKLRPLLRLPKEEFAVPFIVRSSGVPLTLAGMLKHSAMVGDMTYLQPWPPVRDPCLPSRHYAAL